MYRNYLKIFLPLIICLLPLTSCKQATEIAGHPTEIFPLKVGNRWIYQKRTITLSDSIVALSIDTMSITRSDTLQGHVVYFFNNLIIPIYFTREVALFNQYDGLYLVRWSWLITKPPRPPDIDKVLKYPTFLNDTLLFEDLIVLTTATSTKFETETKSYYCTQYDFYSDTSKIMTILMAPGYGIIQCSYQDGNLKNSFLLKSTTLK
ncbi:MAG: hypothetical protein HY800_01855 [Ignavibacteriales bacterium]|nr:hypothetical protein [Ignavibacteriales bacterium]